jgi:hypothetical protein
MSDTILDHDAIRSRIKSAVYEAVGRWPADGGVEKVLDKMIKERDRTGNYLTPIAKRAIRDFQDVLRLPSATSPNRRITCGPLTVAMIALARETEGPERGGQCGMWGKGGTGRDGGAGL